MGQDARMLQSQYAAGAGPHLLLGLGVALVLLRARARRASAAGAPGSLTQLTPPNDCWQQTLVNPTQDCVSNENGLTGTQDVVVSPDGQNVYVVASGDNAIDQFSRSATDGSLTPLEHQLHRGPVQAPRAVRTSRPPVSRARRRSRSARTATTSTSSRRTANGFGTIAEFARNPSDGSLIQLSPNDCIAENPAPYDTSSRSDCLNQSGHGINQPFALAVSPDGQNVYVGDRAGAVAEFTRHANGSLSQLNGANDCIEGNGQNDCATSGNGLADVTGVVVSPDGGNVYTGGATGNDFNGLIAEFTRNADGSLAQLPAPNDCIQGPGGGPGCGTVGAGLVGITGLAVSPDGRNVYGASEANNSPIVEFARNGDGSLTQLAAPNDCIRSRARLRLRHQRARDRQRLAADRQPGRRERLRRRRAVELLPRQLLRRGGVRPQPRRLAYAAPEPG